MFKINNKLIVPEFWTLEVKNTTMYAQITGFV